MRWNFAVGLALTLTAGCQSLSSQLEEKLSTDPPAKAKTEKAAGKKSPEPSAETSTAKKLFGDEAPSVKKRPTEESPDGVVPPPPAATKAAPKSSGGPTAKTQGPEDDRSRALDAIATKLASAARPHALTFHVESLRNPRAKIQHTADGHIFVSDRMLEELRDEQELAGAVALEMAKHICERKSSNGETFEGEEGEAAQATSPDKTIEQRVDAIARELLARGGFSSFSLAKARQRLREIEFAESRSATPRELKRTLAN